MEQMARLVTPGCRFDHLAPDPAVPADDALGPDQDQVSAPVTAESAGHNPEEFVAGAQPRSSPSRPCQYGELMTQQDIFGDQCLTVAHGPRMRLSRSIRYSSITRTSCRSTAVVGPPDFCSPTVVLETLHHFEDIATTHRVEGCGRLIQNQEVR